MKRFIATMSMLAAAAFSMPASAYDAVADAKIMQVEITYMPDHIVFWTDTAIGACPAGGMLDWVPRNATQSGKDQNTQAALAALMTAKSTGARMRLFVINNGCKVEFIYLL